MIDRHMGSTEQEVKWENYTIGAKEILKLELRFN